MTSTSRKVIVVLAAAVACSTAFLLLAAPAAAQPPVAPAAAPADGHAGQPPVPIGSQNRAEYPPCNKLGHCSREKVDNLPSLYYVCTKNSNGPFKIVKDNCDEQPIDVYCCKFRSS